MKPSDRIRRKARLALQRKEFFKAFMKWLGGALLANIILFLLFILVGGKGTMSHFIALIFGNFVGAGLVLFLFWTKGGIK